jgi:hypothetical protein
MRRRLGQVVTGLEHACHDSDDRFENSAFAKYHFYGIDTDQVETFDNSIRHIEDTTHRFGAEDGLRVRLTRGVSREGVVRVCHPVALLGSALLGRFLPLSEDARFALGFALAIPLWLAAMCVVRLARSSARAWLWCVGASLLLGSFVFGVAH